jgi:hypothetical protein
MSKSSRSVFKLRQSKQDPPVGLMSMQVIIVGNLLPRSRTELAFLQIQVTTERIDEHGESSATESEYELQKVASIPQTSPSEVQEEDRS